jgi:exonuclease SbcC
MYAVDTRRDQRKALNELSDATRIQLLLSARLATIEAQEGTSGPLPLGLDQVLSTTDPGRFAEVAGSVLELVCSGRQVLYFTDDPIEISRWGAACAACSADPPTVLALGATDGQGAPWGGEITVAPPPLSTVPAPEGMDPDAYARMLDVPAADGFRPVADWHLIHVLYDDLSALRQCLQRRIDRVGPWQEARRGVDFRVIDEAVAQRVDARVRLLEATLETWRIGRGRPVTWDDVVASSAVSGAFEAQVRTLVGLTRDAKAFVATVGALPYFRAENAAKLRACLEERGLLDPAEPLDVGAVVRRALAMVSEEIVAGVFTAEEAAAFVEGIVKLLG